MERGSSIEQIVGVSDKEEANLLGMFDASFEHQVHRELEGRERPKTPEELQICALVDEFTDRLCAKYKESPIRVPEQNIHMVDPDKWFPNIPKDVGGFYSASEQLVVLESQASKSGFAARLMHELVHFKMFNAMQVVEGEVNEETKEIVGSIEDYRNGVSGFSRDGKDKYLMAVNEAIIEELVKRNLPAIMVDASFDDEKKNMEMMRHSANRTLENPEADSGSKGLSDIILDDDTFNFDLVRLEDPRTKLLQGIVPGRESNPLIERFAYPEERNNLQTLMGLIHSQYPDKFETEDDVFELFVSCSMKGHLLPIGRLVDEAFGKGTFRTIGELSGDETKMPRDLQEYFHTLESES